MRPIMVPCKHHHALEECIKAHITMKLAPHIKGKPYPTETYLMTVEELQHLVKACQRGMQLTDNIIAEDAVLNTLNQTR